ncbi:VOC family protein [Achromobacter denitrificans]|jgi:catechol 2,3-dioxygenase-like lactoylglutathione lyase family enzyme|uniref:VOC family protein n=1 Tax=Achromobacter denitrificans TaxID=32002 RepID=A0ABZ3GDX1_ACHDE|nr:VOC family protein [Achromobacter denitrificans]
MSTFVPVERLHHWAHRCRDAEETRHFYEDVLGLPLAHIIRADEVPSTGEHCPYVHLFFELGDGSWIAFFDLGDDTAAEPSPNTPRWVNHLALQVASEGDLLKIKDQLVRAGVDVIGPIDHGFVKSIYFFDPNGVRMEFSATVCSPEDIDTFRNEARPALDAWTREKLQRKQQRRGA